MTRDRQPTSFKSVPLLLLLAQQIISKLSILFFSIVVGSDISPTFLSASAFLKSSLGIEFVVLWFLKFLVALIWSACRSLDHHQVYFFFLFGKPEFFWKL